MNIPIFKPLNLFSLLEIAFNVDVQIYKTPIQGKSLPWSIYVFARESTY